MIFHITGRRVWEAARRAGAYRPPSLAADGFIHCSNPRQVERVLASHFAGQKDLVQVAIDPARLQARVRWEPGEPGGGELFPHVYGPINLDSVVEVRDLVDTLM